MSVDIEWATPAFEKLEGLPETLAFEIVRRVDLLRTFPEMGVSLHSKYRQLRNCRQLIISGSYRVIYEFASANSLVYVLEVQHCRQKLPTASELKRRISRRDESE